MKESLSQVSSPYTPSSFLLTKWDKDKMMREAVKAYSKKLPKCSKNKDEKTDVELAEQITDLKIALNTARQELQLETVKTRRRAVKGGKVECTVDTTSSAQLVSSHAHLTFRNGLDDSILNRYNLVLKIIRPNILLKSLEALYAIILKLFILLST
eukprot:TRINITY_DN23568_c0_g1_i2.p1 TRINITY_DN23568_c0_g1~~TRINITY_DN23568_c0_g1_i2.p1  ORF type:complete len:155 (-),score=16.12 TRINITY_DN23568_c0_g1_i2:14-478(-)